MNFPHRNRTYDQKCDHFMAAIPSGLFTGLSPFVDAESWHEQDAAFWKLSARLRGAINRLRATHKAVRICQLSVAYGFVTPEDAAEVMLLARLQLWFTLRAVPEALLCRFTPGLPHVSARMALQYCASVFARTHTLCLSKDAPECLNQLSNL